MRWWTKQLDQKVFAGALATLIGLLDDANAALERHGWLSGDVFGLADAGILPDVLRLDHVAMAPVIEARPRLLDWYQRVQALPAYETAVEKWLAAPIVEMFRRNGQAVWADVKPLTK